MSVTLNYDSDFYEDDAIQLGMLRRIIFRNEDPHEKLDEWLNKYRPSQICKGDGFGWIVINQNRQFLEQDAICKRVLACDVVGLQQGWDDLKISGRMITYQEMNKLAKSYNMLGGKWFFYAQTGANVDQAWAVLANGLMSGALSMSTTLRVSTYDPDNTSRPIHSVYICNEDFTNTDNVFKLEQEIRDLGIKSRLLYKPDIYTALGIYRRNKWDLRPTIYISNYHVNGFHSVITTLFR